MRKTPPILHIIYTDGRKARLALHGHSDQERNDMLKYWTATSATKTAFLAWK